MSHMSRQCNVRMFCMCSGESFITFDEATAILREELHYRKMHRITIGLKLEELME